ncbi:MAG: hypothetical protein BWZ07_01015 [Alphaproteobacteria bacterium ADurb.BinA280]|jgi:hypothetical protein|nr:MAG: hypothetical protein BWZ07_01015 [Alphaproteobacteria bacterium ADurb.BinA280]
MMVNAEMLERQRAAAKRTVWVLVGVALLVYVGFIASGVLGR